MPTCMCYADLLPVSSGFWYQILALITTTHYSKPETGVHMTKMTTYDWSMVLVSFHFL